jgi:hypothetical protein
MDKKKIERAEKEIREAENAVLDAAESCSGEEKEYLLRAARDIERAESEITELQE